MRSRIAAVVALFTIVGGALSGATAQIDIDHVRAVNIMPPGESGAINIPGFVQSQVTGSFGPHYADQAPLYAAFQYKPDAFGKGAVWANLPGAVVYRDAWDVPQIYASDRAALYRAFGYAMAADRLFQMEIFRRVGQGRLAALLGQQYVAMDREVLLVSEGPEGRAAEWAKAPQEQRTVLQAFGDGINQFVDEASTNPNKTPAEFVLLNDLPIAPWTIDDSLAFGEYAGRFFGEFGHSELNIAATYAKIVKARGHAAARKIVDDLYPLDDPDAPVTIPREDGVFPRHVGEPGISGGSEPVNDEPASIGGSSALIHAAAARDNIQATVGLIQHVLGVTGFGSNQYVVDGDHTANGNPLLVSEPQTGIAAPSFFWEAELHGGGFDVRGVTVPGLPFIAIGRNEVGGWAVTSALDANADTFAERLSKDGTSYLHDGKYHKIKTKEVTIACNTPPTAVLDLVDGDTSSVCEESSTTITVRRTGHGPLISAPDVPHRVAYSRQSVVDGRILTSLDAWTRTTQARTVAEYRRAASGVAFGFNFMYVTRGGDAAYFHVGRYPIRPSDVDPRFPIPGTGQWDWQGFEKFSDQPQVVNPRRGFLANWNNKPAHGWVSKPTESASIPPAPNPPREQIGTWGPAHQVQTIQRDLARVVPNVRFIDMAIIEKHVASIDNRARVFMPALLDAIDAAHDPSLRQARALLAAWDQNRVDVNHDDNYDAPGLAIFDRWVELVLRRTFGGVLDPTAFQIAGDVRDDGHYFSSDNEDTPTFKFDTALLAVFAHMLTDGARFDYLGSASTNAVMVASLRKALASLKTAMGADMYSWREPAEHEPYSPLGGGSAEDVTPVLNRGSYGQIVEPGGKPATKILITP